MAMWLTTAVWLGNRISLVSWWLGLTRPFCAVRTAGVAASGSTMKAPLALMRTLPGLVMVPSISSVEVIVRGRVRGSSSGGTPFGGNCWGAAAT